MEYRYDFDEFDLVDFPDVDCSNPRCHHPSGLAKHPVTELCAGCIAEDLEDRLCRLQELLPEQELENPESKAWRYIEARWDFLDKKGIEGINNYVWDIRDGRVSDDVFSTCEGRR